jgi:hypothetical protein
VLVGGFPHANRAPHLPDRKLAPVAAMTKNVGPFMMNAPGNVTTNAAGGSRFASTFFHPDCTVGVGIPASLSCWSPHSCHPALQQFDSRAYHSGRMTYRRSGIGNISSLTLPRRSIFSSASYHSQGNVPRQVGQDTVIGGQVSCLGRKALADRALHWLSTGFTLPAQAAQVQQEARAGRELGCLPRHSL